MAIKDVFSALSSGYNSLTNPTNKVRDEKGQEQGAADLVEELKLSMPDDELLSLSKEWRKAWNSYQPEINKKREENEKYWLGQHYSNAEKTAGEMSNSRPYADNIIFEALETFLPIATQRNPDPMVVSDDTDEGKELAENTRKMLIYHSDRLRVKLRLKRVTRFWALYLLGVAKIGWSTDENDLTVSVIRPQNLILDPDAEINDDMEYTGEYIGEFKEEKASSLIRRFPDKKKEIEDEVKGKMGTKVKYIEWWTDDYLFWTMKEVVLDKRENPHWNEEETRIVVDEMGNETEEMLPAMNHFSVKKKPYVFLSVYNLGIHPNDETSLIGQNLSNQDIVNTKQMQILKNTNGMNGGWVISGERSGLTREQATQAIEAARKGGGLYIESGNPNEAAVRMTGSGLPADVFNQLADTRNELRNIFGTRGSTPQGTTSEQTVRGKIIIREQDSSRIGGGVSEYLEQFADQLYNWMVQMMMVYYDDEHVGAILGSEKAMQHVAIQRDMFRGRKITVSVKPGSLIPKDPLTEANQAIDLAGAGLLDPISMFEALDHPNPREAAQKLFLWKAAPELLFEQEQDEAVPIGQRVMQSQQNRAIEEAGTQMALNQELAAQNPEGEVPKK